MAMAVGSRRGSNSEQVKGISEIRCYHANEVSPACKWTKSS